MKSAPSQGQRLFVFQRGNLQVGRVSAAADSAQRGFC